MLNAGKILLSSDKNAVPVRVVAAADWSKIKRELDTSAQNWACRTRL